MISSSEIGLDLSKEADNKQLSVEKAREGILKMGDPAIGRVYEAMKGKDLPMLFRFKTPSENNAYYAGTIHPHNLTPAQNQEQTQGLKNAFDQFTKVTSDKEKRMVLIEGSEPGNLTNKYSSLEDALERGGEMGAITWYGKESGIDVISADIPTEATVAFMKEQGVPDLDIALNFAFRNVHSHLTSKDHSNGMFTQGEVFDLLMNVSLLTTGWDKEYAQQSLDQIKQQGGFKTPEGRAQVQDYINTTLSKLNSHLKENSKFIKNETTGEKGIQLIVQKGMDSVGNPIFASEYNPDRDYQKLSNPFLDNPDNPKGLLNQLSAKLSDNRDQYILGQIVDKINDGYDLFIGFGNSHAIQESAGLINAGCTTSDYPLEAINPKVDLANAV